MSKTIAQLLAEGRAILEENAAKRRAEDEANAQRNWNHWIALVNQIAKDIGEELMATSEPGMHAPPQGFWCGTLHFEFLVRPFGAGAIRIKYATSGGPPSWHLVSVRNSAMGKPSFSVETGYHVGKFFNEDTLRGGATVVYHRTEDASTLAEAVALCELQTQGYLDAVKAAEQLKNIR